MSSVSAEEEPAQKTILEVSSLSNLVAGTPEIVFTPA
jgi:hypothetical protein